jgi:hypothetical protein
VATGGDQVRSYLAGRGRPAEEIGRLIAEAHRAGTVTVPEAPEPGRPAGRLRLSVTGSTCQLTIQGTWSGAPQPREAVAWLTRP